MALSIILRLFFYSRDTASSGVSDTISFLTKSPAVLSDFVCSTISIASVKEDFLHNELSDEMLAVSTRAVPSNFIVVVDAVLGPGE
jgi:hypothetical protein